MVSTETETIISANASFDYRLTQSSPQPTCSFGVDDCNSVWYEWVTAVSSWSSNSIANTWTISLANPPNSMVLNGVTKTLAEGPMTTPPPLTINNTIFTAKTYTTTWDSANSRIVDVHRTFYNFDFITRWIDDSSYSLVPVSVEYGGIVTWTETLLKPRKPLCDPNLTSGGGGSPCTIHADSISLLYFPVPTTVSRDMCATSPIEDPITSLPTEIASGESPYFHCRIRCCTNSPGTSSDKIRPIIHILVVLKQWLHA